MGKSPAAAPVSGGLSSRDVTLAFWACTCALAALYAFAPANAHFSVSPGSPAARAPAAPVPLAPTLECVRRLMEPSFVVPPRPFSWAVFGAHFFSVRFALRCAIAGGAGLAMYLCFAAFFHALFPRRPVLAGRERAMFDLSRWDSDLSLGVLGIVCGAPVQQGFMVCKEQFGFSLAYADVADGRVALPAWLPAPAGGLVLEGWTWWLLSLPVYLFMFDLVFYWTHLILHWGPVYRYFHANHHAFRPPTAWSGIAIDPVENVLTGMMPLHIPLFFLPFHLYTVFGINIVLLGWATLLHSGASTPGGWLFIGPQDHNVHHARGLENKNFSAIFSVWDLLFGTLDREGWTQGAMVPFWTQADRDARAAKQADAAAPAPALAPALAAAVGGGSTRRKSVVTAGLRSRRAAAS